MRFNLETLSVRERLAWKRRYQYGWQLKRIGLEMGLSVSGVSKLLGRARVRAGLPKYRISVIRTKPRLATVYSLSDVFDY